MFLFLPEEGHDVVLPLPYSRRYLDHRDKAPNNINCNQGLSAPGSFDSALSAWRYSSAGIHLKYRDRLNSSVTGLPLRAGGHGAVLAQP